MVNERSKNGFEMMPFVSEPRTAFTVNSFASAGALPTAIKVWPRGMLPVNKILPVSGSHNQ